MQLQLHKSETPNAVSCQSPRSMFFFSTKRRHYEIAKQCQNSSAERSPLIVRNTCHKEQALTTHKEHVTRNASDKKRVHLRGLHLRVSYEIRHTPPPPLPCKLRSRKLEE